MDAAKAIRYNAAARGVNFKLLELPAPYKTNEPGTRRFAEMVYIFQVLAQPPPAGMRGPITLAALPASDLAAGMKEAKAAKKATPKKAAAKKSAPKKATASSS